MSERLSHFAKRVEGDPFFLAASLAAFARSESLDDAGLAAALGLSSDELTHLKLCRPPRPEPEHFWPDCQRLAVRFQIDPEKFSEVVSRGRVLLTFQRDTPAAGTLRAARERPDQES